MNGFWLALRPASRRIAAWFMPAAAATLGLPFLLAAAPPGDGYSPLALWLHLPSFCWCALVGSLALDSWPTFGRERPGAVWLERIPGEPWRAAAAAAVHFALGALGLVTLALLFGAALSCRGQPAPAARTLVCLAEHTTQRVDQQTPVLTLAGIPPGAHRLRLQPRALLAAAGIAEPARLIVQADGHALHEVALQIHGNDAPIELQLPAGDVTSIRIERLPGPGLALAFPAGSLGVYLHGSHGAGWNAMLAAGSWLLPMLPCLAAMLLLRRRLSLPLLQLSWLLLLLACAFAPALMPMGTAMQSYASGHWLGNDPLTAPASCVVVCAMTFPIAAAGLTGSQRT